MSPKLPFDKYSNFVKSNPSKVPVTAIISSKMFAMNRMQQKNHMQARQIHKNTVLMQSTMTYTHRPYGSFRTKEAKVKQTAK